MEGRLFAEGDALRAEYTQAGLTVQVGEGRLRARGRCGCPVKEELSQIVGLQPVKDYILSLEDNFKIQQLRRERGLAGKGGFPLYAHDFLQAIRARGKPPWPALSPDT